MDGETPMKAIITAAAFALAAGTPALAASITIEFTPDDGGEATSFTFDDATGMATGPDGSSASYTWDEESSTICGTDPEGSEVCATFTETGVEPAVGVSSPYTLNTGGGGTATITAMEE